jgi:hypothetical protein
MKARKMKVVAMLATFAAGLAAVLVAAGGRTDAGRALAKAPEAPRPLLAIVGGRKPRLVRVEPATLQILAGRSVRLRSGTPGAVRSPGGRRLAVGGTRIWIVDVERMRLLGSVRSPDRRGSLEPIAWFRSGLLVVLDWAGDSKDLLVVDPQQWRVVARRPLDGEVIGRAETVEGERLVLLLASGRELGPARLVVVDGGGEVRSVALDRIEAGMIADPGRPGSFARWPGVAVDGAGRAFVAGAGTLVAEVDLDSFAIAYHELSEPVSLLGRLRNWFEPEARADLTEGPTRHLRWLGDGLIAVSGNDTEFTEGRVRQTPAGLKIIDTRTWTVRTIDERVNRFTLAGDLLLASSPTFDSATRKHSGIGLVAYTTSGERRFHLFESEPVWAYQTLGRYAYVPRHPDYTRTAIVDLVSGKVVHDVMGRTPFLVGAAT